MGKIDHGSPARFILGWDKIIYRIGVIEQEFRIGFQIGQNFGIAYFLRISHGIIVSDLRRDLIAIFKIRINRQ